MNKNTFSRPCFFYLCVNTALFVLSIHFTFKISDKLWISEIIRSKYLHMRLCQVKKKVNYRAFLLQLQNSTQNKISITEINN